MGKRGGPFRWVGGEQARELTDEARHEWLQDEGTSTPPAQSSSRGLTWVQSWVLSGRSQHTTLGAASLGQPLGTWRAGRAHIPGREGRAGSGKPTC